MERVLVDPLRSISRRSPCTTRYSRSPSRRQAHLTHRYGRTSREDGTGRLIDEDSGVASEAGKDLEVRLHLQVWSPAPPGGRSRFQSRGADDRLSGRTSARIAAWCIRLGAAVTTHRSTSSISWQLLPSERSWSTATTRWRRDLSGTSRGGAGMTMAGAWRG